eukprot:GHVS01077748.1.p1 GENE.GHVS01077748.1~~GHVS01077748.1.p1  ORF type:complete len:505 (+),score=103.99 GHVS01077748.1:458-1972(+)
MHKFNFDSKTWHRIGSVAAETTTTTPFPCSAPPCLAEQPPQGSASSAGGGDAAEGRPSSSSSSSTAVFDDSTTWPAGRENNGAVIWGGALYLFGGYSGYNWLNDFHRFDFGLESWTKIETQGNRPSTRFGYVTGVCEEEGVLFVFGGYDGIAWLNDMCEYNFTDNMWAVAQQAGTLPSGRSCPTWGTYKDSIYVFGGYDGIQRMNDFHRFMFSSRTWTSVNCCGDIPSPRYFHACVVHADRLYLFGGYNGQDRLNDLYQYQFDRNEWVAVDVENRPSGRSSLVAQVHKDSLYVFGGYNGQVVLNDFYELRLEAVHIPPSTLLSDLRQLINNKELADVSFLVEGQPVYATRALLAARSDHFRALFYGGMKEAHQTADQPIIIQDVSHEVFLAILEYLYTDTLPAGLSSESAVQLLIAAQRFLLDRLKGLCEDICRRGITVENVVNLLLAAEAHHAEGLKIICMEYLTEYEERLVQTNALKRLVQEPALLYEVYQRSVRNRTKGSS